MILLMSLGILLIVIIIIAYLFKVLERRRTTGRNRLSRKTIMWLFTAYGVILIAATLLFYLTPMNRNTSLGPLAMQNQISTAENANQYIDEAAHNGTIDQLKGVSVSKKWHYHYNGKELFISYNKQQPFIMYVQRKTTNDGQIDVIQYQTMTYVKNMDLTHLIKPPSLQLQGDTLTVSMPRQVSINITRLNPEFTIQQFSRDKNSQQDHILNHVIGRQVLYMKVPKDLKVSGKLLQFVGK